MRISADLVYNIGKPIVVCAKKDKFKSNCVTLRNWMEAAGQKVVNGMRTKDNRRNIRV